MTPLAPPPDWQAPAGSEDVTAAVARFRARVAQDFPTPGLRDAYIYLTTEVGELGDLLLRTLRPADLRTDPDKLPTRGALVDEIGDTLFMLATVANHLDISLTEALAHTLDKVDRRVARGRREEAP